MNKLPRLNIAHLPTPIESLPRLSEHLGGPKLLVKRDDQTGLAFGGNKTRKLEFLVGEALATGAKMLVTAGAVQSNHCRQTAAAASRYGLDCTLVLSGDPPRIPSANLLLDHLFGVDIIWTSRDKRDDTLQEAFNDAMNAGKHPYLVPYGGSSPTGAVGYAFAIQELLEQGIHPDWIVFASSSGGTQAGLMAGAKLFGYGGKILGISIDEPEVILRKRVTKLASEVSGLLGAKTSFSPDEILVNASYCEPGYGVLTSTEIQAIKLFALQEGLLLDPVYTGRAAGGLIDLIHKATFSKGETVLFWHTGGTPGLFAKKYRDQLI